MVRAALLLLLVTAACKGDGASASLPGRAPLTRVNSDAVPALPKTTSASLAVGNLDGSASELFAEFESGDLSPERMLGAIDVLLDRAHFLGKASDYQRALKVADALIAARPDGSAYLSRARVLTILHRFAEAEAALHQAETKNVARAKTLPRRAALALALGRVDEALTLQVGLAQERPTLHSLGTVAISQAESGDLAGAERNFRRALASYHDVSPLPVAWLYFQWGLGMERNGQKGMARRFYEAAVERLPQYAPLVSHLAGLLAESGDEAGAATLLRPVAESADDPQFLGQLSALEKRLKHDETAARLAATATSMYDELLAHHRLAFADHAARFFLSTGDAKRAFALAEENLAARPTDAAYQLWFDAAFAARADPQGSCVAADDADLDKPSAYLLFTRARAYRGCGRSDDADRLLAQAKTVTKQQ